MTVLVIAAISARNFSIVIAPLSIGDGTVENWSGKRVTERALRLTRRDVMMIVTGAGCL